VVVLHGLDDGVPVPLPALGVSGRCRVPVQQFLEQRMDEGVVLGADLPVDERREHGLHTRGDAHEHAGGPGGRDGEDGNVAARGLDVRLVGEGERAAFGRQALGGFGSSLTQRRDDRVHRLAALLRVVPVPHLDQGVGQAHDAQAETPELHAHLSVVFEREAVDVQYVVEEANAGRDVLAERRHVETSDTSAGVMHVSGDVHRPEVAWFARVQWYLAAWIGTLYGTERI